MQNGRGGWGSQFEIPSFENHWARGLSVQKDNCSHNCGRKVTIKGGDIFNIL